MEDEENVLGEDYFDEMYARIVKLAEETKYSVEKIWCLVNDEFREKGGPSYRGMRKEQVRKLVRNTKMRQVGGNAIGKVEAEFSGNKKDAFLRHSSIFPDEKGPQRMMAFSVPELMSYLNYAMVSSNYIL
jgi:hypothetical protein